MSTFIYGDDSVYATEARDAYYSTRSMTEQLLYADAKKYHRIMMEQETDIDKLKLERAMLCVMTALLSAYVLLYVVL